MERPFLPSNLRQFSPGDGLEAKFLRYICEYLRPADPLTSDVEPPCPRIVVDCNLPRCPVKDQNRYILAFWKFHQIARRRLKIEGNVMNGLSRTALRSAASILIGILEKFGINFAASLKFLNLFSDRLDGLIQVGSGLLRIAYHEAAMRAPVPPDMAHCQVARAVEGFCDR